MKCMTVSLTTIPPALTSVCTVSMFEGLLEKTYNANGLSRLRINSMALSMLSQSTMGSKGPKI